MNIKKIVNPENINLKYVGGLDFYPFGMKEKIKEQETRGFTPLFNLDLENEIAKSVWYPQHIEASKNDELWRSGGAWGISIGIISKDNKPVFIHRSSLNSLNKGVAAPIAGHLKIRGVIKFGTTINLKNMLKKAIISEINQELGLIPDSKILINWSSLEILEVSKPIKQHEFSILTMIDMSFTKIKKLNLDMNFSDKTEIAEKIAKPNTITEKDLENYVGAEQHAYTMMRVLNTI